MYNFEDPNKRHLRNRDLVWHKAIARKRRRNEVNSQRHREQIKPIF